MLKKALDALQRPASSGSIILEIEGLRFIAIVSVLSLHMGTQILRVNPQLQTASDPLYWLTENGSLGVNLFFSISGFILAYPYARHYLSGRPKMPLKQFYFKRLTRLEPPFIINITLLFLVHILLLHETISQLLPHYFATLTYSHMFVYGVWSTINPVTWSLETEVQFYLLAPLIFWGLYSIPKRTVRVLLLIAVIIGISVVHNQADPLYRKWHLHKSLVVYLNNFLTGILFLEFFLWPRFKEKLKASYLWDIATAVAIYSLFEVAPRLPLLWDEILANVCIACMFFGAFKGKIFSLFFRKRFITVIGGMCYTLYLYHYAMFFILSKYTARIPVSSNQFWVQFIVQGTFLLMAVLIICSLLFYWFEKPFMVKNWYKRKVVTNTTEPVAT